MNKGSLQRGQKREALLSTVAASFTLTPVAQMTRLTAATIVILARAVRSLHKVNPGGYCKFHTVVDSCGFVVPPGGAKCTEYVDAAGQMCICDSNGGVTCQTNGVLCMPEPGDSPPRSPASLARTPSQTR